MACSSRLYINAAFDIPLTLAQDSNLTIGEILAGDLEVILKCGAIEKSYKLSGGGISYNGSDLTLVIGQNDISEEGYYNIITIFTDSNGNRRRPTPCSDVLEFHSQ